MSRNLSELPGRKGLKYNLFDEMGKLAQPEGTPPQEELDRLAEEFLIGKANTWGAATFYDFLKPENKGKKVYVCNGTACLCAGTQEAVIQQLGEQFEPSEIGHMTCLGRCHENSAFHYAGKNYSGDAVASLGEIIKKEEDKNTDSYHVVASGKAVLTRPFTSIDDFYAPFLQALKMDAGEVLDQIKSSGLRGRGGAGFPMGLKLEFCRKESSAPLGPGSSDTKFIICNADEGDPGAYSDRYLLGATSAFGTLRHDDRRLCDRGQQRSGLHSCRISGVRSDSAGSY